MSKDSPASIHILHKLLSDRSGLSQTIEIRKDRLESFKKKGKRLMYSADNIKVVTASGESFSYMQTNGKGQVRFDEAGIVADHFLITVPRPLKDFGIELQSGGTYNQDEGGGWYCKTPLYYFEGKYYSTSF